MQYIILGLVTMLSIGCASAPPMAWIHSRQMNLSDPGPTDKELNADRAQCHKTIKEIAATQQLDHPLLPTMLYAFCMENRGYKLFEILPPSESKEPAKVSPVK